MDPPGSPWQLTIPRNARSYLRIIRLAERQLVFPGREGVGQGERIETSEEREGGKSISKSGPFRRETRRDEKGQA